MIFGICSGLKSKSNTYIPIKKFTSLLQAVTPYTTAPAFLHKLLKMEKLDLPFFTRYVKSYFNNISDCLPNINYLFHLIIRVIFSIQVNTFYHEVFQTLDSQQTQSRKGNTKWQ